MPLSRTSENVCPFSKKLFAASQPRAHKVRWEIVLLRSRLNCVSGSADGFVMFVSAHAHARSVQVAWS